MPTHILFRPNELLSRELFTNTWQRRFSRPTCDHVYYSHISNSSLQFIYCATGKPPAQPLTDEKLEKISGALTKDVVQDIAIEHLKLKYAEVKNMDDSHTKQGDFNFEVLKFWKSKYKGTTDMLREALTNASLGATIDSEILKILDS